MGLDGVGVENCCPVPPTIAGSGEEVVVGVPVNSDWNLISLPLVPSNNLRSKVLAAQIAANDFTIICSYQNGKWSSATLSNGKLFEFTNVNG